MNTETTLQRTLPPVYYYDPAIFMQERDQMLANQWFFVAHRSEFSDAGDFKCITLLKTEVLIVLQKTGEIKALSNRCIHRGATLVTQKSGHAKNFSCPYHGWCFSKDGTLRSTRGQMPDLEKKEALSQFEVKEVAGLVLLRLKDKKTERAREIDALAPFWDFYGTGFATALQHKNIVCNANWKIVVENFLECFHCAYNHPELSAVEKHVELLESNNIHQFMTLQQAYFRRAEQLGHPIPASQFIDSNAKQYSIINAVPLSNDIESGTLDGKLHAPIMGQQQASDGGFLFGSLGPFVHFSLYTDYCVFFNFMPTSSTTTEIEVTWLVKKAESDFDNYDSANKDAICWLWEPTIEQDCALCELVQQQVESFEAKPGVYTQMEADSASFCNWYRKQMPIFTNEIVA